MTKQSPLKPRSKYGFIASLACVFIISSSVLTFEITLTRIFSVAFSYHYSFLAVSLALFGLGSGGILAHLFFSKASSENVFKNMTLLSLLFSLSISLLTIAVASAAYSNVFADALIMFFPFFIAGIFLATTYKVFAVYGNIVYFFDLVGAAMGSLIVLILLPQHGAINTVLLIGIISSIGSLLLATASKKKMVVFLTIANFLLLVFLTQYFHTNQVLEIMVANNQDKELADFFNEPSLGAKIVDSRWSTFGRTDLVEFEKFPDMKIIFVDGGAGTKMYRFDGDLSNTSSEINQLKNSTAYYPYYFADKEKALIIGPGGGVDVLNALMANVSHITAVEVNPETVNIVRDYSDFNGGIYTKYDNVHVFVDEGRSFLKRTFANYNVIMLNIPVTKTGQGISGYSLAENYLFTTDSFKDYFDHLEDQGYLVIVAHSPLEIYKLAAVTLKVFREEGVSISQSMRHIVATGMHFPVFILKKSAFTQEEIGGLYAKSNELGLAPVYFPYIDSQNLDPIFTALAKEKLDLNTLVSHLGDHYGLDIEPPTDDRPFFYKYEKGLPTTLSQLLVGSIVLSIVILFLYLGTWSRRLRTARTTGIDLLAHKFSSFMAYYFSSLGLGFMLIEAALIQKFILFLGNPVTAISVILFSLLLSSGIGGLCSKRLKGETLRPALRSSLIVGILAITYLITLPSLFNMLLSYESTIRFLISALLLFPLGFFMGMPFPLGIRFLGKEKQENIPWMWGLNGTCSLLGSVLAIALAVNFGFNTTFLLGGLSYLAIFTLGHFKLEMEKTPGEIAAEKEKRKREKERKKRERRDRRQESSFT